MFLFNRLTAKGVCASIIIAKYIFGQAIEPTGGNAVIERTSPTAPTADVVRFHNRLTVRMGKKYSDFFAYKNADLSYSFTMLVEEFFLRDAFCIQNLWRKPKEVALCKMQKFQQRLLLTLQ